MARRSSSRPAAHRALVRPTQARVRDALFNSLGTRVAGARVLDLFAGSGALGLAALAHGAAEAVFVERDRRLVEGIREALAKQGSTDRAEVWRRDALAAVRELGARGRVFDLVFMDPPYGEGWIPRTLRAIGAARIMAGDGLIVGEGHWRDRPRPEDRFTPVRETRYGETALWYFEVDTGGEQG